VVSPTAILEGILDVLEEVAETDEVRENASLDLFGEQVLDSLRTAELIVRVSDMFGLEISPAEFDREAWGTPEKIVADVTRRLREAGRTGDPAGAAG